MFIHWKNYYHLNIHTIHENLVTIISIKILKIFKNYLENPKTHMETQKISNSHSNHKKKKLKKKAEGITTTDCRTYHRTVINQKNWFWLKDIHVDQWNRIETP